MLSDITDNIKTALDGLNSYGGAVTVEHERKFLSINERYPFVILCGPYTGVDTEQSQVHDNEAVYIVKHIVYENDANYNDFEEMTFRVRNVAADIKKILMIDPSRGNRVQFTRFLNSGHAIEEIDYRMEFFVYVTLNIGYRNIISNPSIYG